MLCGEGAWAVPRGVQASEKSKNVTKKKPASRQVDAHRLF
jgi:hypothetical protein